MTKNRGQKDVIRARQQKTGESYTAARAALGIETAPEQPRKSWSELLVHCIESVGWTVDDWPFLGELSDDEVDDVVFVGCFRDASERHRATAKEAWGAVIAAARRRDRRACLAAAQAADASLASVGWRPENAAPGVEFENPARLFDGARLRLASGRELTFDSKATYVVSSPFDVNVNEGRTCRLVAGDHSVLPRRLWVQFLDTLRYAIVAVDDIASVPSDELEHRINERAEAPPSFRGRRWDTSPSVGMRCIAGPMHDEKLALWTQDNPPAFLEMPVVEQVFMFTDGRLYGGQMFIDGRQRFDVLKEKLSRAYGPPDFVNERLYLFKWKWTTPKLYLGIYYQPRFDRVTVTLENDSI